MLRLDNFFWFLHFEEFFFNVVGLNVLFQNLKLDYIFLNSTTFTSLLKIYLNWKKILNSILAQACDYS